jgi:hypothetical protein
LWTLPSTVQSATAYSSLAGGDVAVSVIAAALLNIVGVFVTAPLFSLLGGGGDRRVRRRRVIKVFTILLLPFVLGQAAQRWLAGWVAGHRSLVTWMDRGSIATAVYVAFSAAVRQGIWTASTSRDGRRSSPGARCSWSSALAEPGPPRARCGSTGASASRSCSPARRRASRWVRPGDGAVPARGRRHRPAADADLPSRAAGWSRPRSRRG